MEVVGVIALVLVAIAVLVGIVIALLSLPDLARYRRLRKM